MAQLRCESPLNWPVGLIPTPRQNQRSDSSFPAQLSLAEAIQNLQDELSDDRFGAASLSIDIEQPLVERLRKKTGNRTGASLQFKHQNRLFVISCDRWLSIEHNIYALYLTIRHWKNMERWGTGSLLALISGFEAGSNRRTTAAAAMGQGWMEAFGVSASATLDDVTAIYHRRAKLVAHDTEALTRLNLLMDEARDYYSGKDS